MHGQKPAQEQVWQAIELYLKTAYDQAPPAAVRARLEKLRSLAAEAFYDSNIFEKSPAEAPNRWRLRLGNRFYPHMKLTLEPAPGEAGWLFRADTHDGHCCPAPSAPEYGEFVKLMAENQRIAQAIEAAWEEARIPTFRSFLREDVARRTNAQG